MKRQTLTAYLLGFGALLGTVPSCVDVTDAEDNGDDYDADSDGKADATSTTPIVSDDNLNGQWITSAGSKPLPDDTVIESWAAIGIKIHYGGTIYAVTRAGNTLTGDGVALTIDPKKAGVRDDVIDGTIAGNPIHFARDVAPKDPITLSFPGDRPYRSWLTDTVLPAAQLDRESYVHLTYANLTKFLYSCELYKHGSWQRTYMKGATYADQAAAFKSIISAVDGVDTSPRQIIANVRFSNAVKAALKDQSKIALALSTFSMYFTTAGGRALRMPITSDSTGYFITDRPTRAERLGLVVMATPTHGPLASTFGRQLLDLGAMPATDSPIYARTLMELLAKSDNRHATQLSATGRSALTDWFSVMAIEDYRGVAFGEPDLGWGYNMTNVQFYGLLVRSLARPAQQDSTGKPVLGQVIVGNQLEPGDPSYADVLNGGNDMQEYPDMAQLKTLATNFLRANHPAQVAAVESAFSKIVPESELDSRAQADIFHYITAELYDSQGRTANLTGALASGAVDAVAALFDTLTTDSAAFEAYVLANGFIKANTPAPKSTGF